MSYDHDQIIVMWILYLMLGQRTHPYYYGTVVKLLRLAQSRQILEKLRNVVLLSSIQCFRFMYNVRTFILFYP